jgi:hypothetical protein
MSVKRAQRIPKPRDRAAKLPVCGLGEGGGRRVVGAAIRLHSLAGCLAKLHFFPPVGLSLKSRKGASNPGGSICLSTRSMEELRISIEPSTSVPLAISTH